MRASAPHSLTGLCSWFYSNASNKDIANAKSLIKQQLDAYVYGTPVIKRSNFSDHVIKSVAHMVIVQLLNVQPANSANSQKSIVSDVRSMNSQLNHQLIMKFQLAHFIAFQGKPFKLYKDFMIEKETHNTKHGDCFLNDIACHEMI